MERVQEAKRGICSWRFRGTDRAVEHRQKKGMIENRGALPKEEGDLVRGYKFAHEDTFSSSWLRDDTEGEAQELEK